VAGFSSMGELGVHDLGVLEPLAEWFYATEYMSSVKYTCMLSERKK